MKQVFLAVILTTVFSGVAKASKAEMIKAVTAIRDARGESCLKKALTSADHQIWLAMGVPLTNISSDIKYEGLGGDRFTITVESISLFYNNDPAEHKTICAMFH